LTRRLLLLLAVSAVLVVAGCGSSSSSGTSKVSHPKTSFVIHAALAFGTFHHFIYKPFKAGDFSHPFSHKLKIAEAVAAGLFVEHEVKLALTDAKGSKLLSHVVVPLGALGSAVALVRAGIADHHPNAKQINYANSSIDSAEFNSTSAGQPIQEQVGSP